jgi:hypothetical protein
MIVTHQVPGFDLGFQQSGHARYLRGFVDHFAALGWTVVLVVMRPSVDFIVRRDDAFEAELIGPSFVRIGRRIAQRSAVGIVQTLAWAGYVRLPKTVQSAADALRLRLRTIRGSVHTLGQFPRAAEIAYVRRVVAERKPEVVLVDGIFNSCGPLACGQQWVITHEVKYQRAESFAKHGVSLAPASFSQDTERRLLEQAGNVIAIQWDDGAELKRLAPGARVVVVPVTTARPIDRREALAAPGRCLFVGSGSYHNYHGIRWFLDECWPAIRARVPFATLDVVGSVCFRLSGVPPGVTLRGVVADLDAVYATAAVTIVPLQIGSGLKVKLVEALSFRQAIVTTSVGAQGLAHFAPRPFVLADSAAAFAEETAALLSAPLAQRQLRIDAAHCARAFTPEAAFAEFDAAISGEFAVV